MITHILTRYQKTIAFFFFTLFFSSMVLPVYSAGDIMRKRSGMTFPVSAGTAEKKRLVNIPSVGMPLSSFESPVNNTDVSEISGFGLSETRIGGPTQPEMSSFKPAGVDNLVNLFTGDFSYNIPLLDVGGYPVNIFYNGGITPDQEASWVGLGWNINPGTVTRNMRGVPDDFNGEDKMIQSQKMKPNKTWGASLGYDLELVGIKSFEMFSGSIGASLGLSFNNYLGPALDFGVKGGTQFKIARSAGSEKSGAVTPKIGAGIGMNVNSRYGVSISPNVSLTASSFENNKGVSGGIRLGTSYNSRSGIKALQISEQMSFNYGTEKKFSKDGANYVSSGSGSMGASISSSTISFTRPSYIPSIRMPLINESFAGRFQLGNGLFGVYGSAEAEVYSQVSKTAEVLQVKPLVGYLYYENAKSNPDAVMDFTRFNDNEVTDRTPVISVPQYSYDVFAIQGEGTGGTVRAYRNDQGYVRDNHTGSQDKSLSLGFDIGIPGHYGGNFNTIKTPTTIGEWKNGNKLRSNLGFRSADKNWENVYFRNPGENSVLNAQQFDKLGGVDLVRYKLGGSSSNPTIEPVLEKFSKGGSMTGTINLLTAADPVERKKRTQVVSFLKAEEAAAIGLDKEIKTYRTDVMFDNQNNLLFDTLHRVGHYRKSHHISQVNVTEANGSRYIYGIPVYNIVQKDFTFSVDDTEIDETDKVSITEAETNLSSGLLNDQSSRDGFVQITETPAYAHSFLLSGLLSPDYVDVTGDGITEDDLGDGVKFNYSRVKQSGSWANYKWRTPLTKENLIANFNAGNLTEVKDDKGIISYGERESWYMHSLESKTMIAIFTLDENDRLDGNGTANEYGGINTADHSIKSLKKIDLYSKADVKKNGLAGARPIKTVHFVYNYSLCQLTPDNAGQGGKLTLERIYFTFNGQNKVDKNQYVFSYGTGNDNPSYSFNASDRWGNYKPVTLNPESLKNSLYPYSNQDKAIKTTLDRNAAAWSLKKILLPSGGQIEVDYETDDYAFVQDKRAAAMMQILGFGNDENTITNKLYRLSGGGIIENDYVFIQVPDACNSGEDVKNKYLSGMDQLSFKIAVNMPKGIEYIPMYATIAGYGVHSSNDKIIWVRLNKMDGLSPLSLTAVEYLRERLPGQAFEGYDLSGSEGLQQIGDMLMGWMAELLNGFKNPVKRLREDGKAQTVVAERSFVRLNDPDGYKYGGGVRVKSVKLKDNWQAMTGQYTSTYGQLYNYETQEVFNGVSRTISSGVASYEPSIGGEENPFQQILQIANTMPLGPTSYGAIELPFLDAFFPAASVGYSKVTVRSLNTNTDPSKKSRSGIGKQVTEYYTAKDYPVYYDYTRLDPASDLQRHSSTNVFFYKYAFDSRALSQGFIVEINDMHGKMKSQASYPENDENTPVNYTQHFYRNTGGKGLNEKFDFVHASQAGKVDEGNMGIDIELMTDTREFTVKSSSLEIQGQMDLFPIVIPAWVPFIWPVSGNSENNYRAVTTTKIINYHSVLDSIVVIDKGSLVSTKNILYDAETGDVLVNRTNNEFNQPVYTTKYPAYWAYDGMGLAYKNIDTRFSGINFNNGKITNFGFDFSHFESGDELYLSNPGSTPEDDCGERQESESTRLLWAFDQNKNQSSTLTAKDFIFIDAAGKPYTKAGVDLRVVRSGKRNHLNAQVASVTLMNSPVVLSGGIRKLTIDATSKVINSSASLFREKWQADEGVIERINYDTIVNTTDGFCYTSTPVEYLTCNAEPVRNVNPYRKGLLGNFRGDRAYVYYGERNEKDPSLATNIQSNGFIKDFSLFWNFNLAGRLAPDYSNASWVWNSKINRVNSRGLELETNDALNVYTAAQYGYNKSTPIAITSNAKYHEAGFEGFEDYGYQESINGHTSLQCKSHFGFTDVLETELLLGRPGGPGGGLGRSAVRLINTDTADFSAHTGKYALSIDSGISAIKGFELADIVDSFNLKTTETSVTYGPWTGVSQGPRFFTYCGTQLVDSTGGNISSTTIGWGNPGPGPGNYTNLCAGYFGPTEIVMRFFYKATTTGNVNVPVSIFPGGGSYSLYILRDSVPFNTALSLTSSTPDIFVASDDGGNASLGSCFTHEGSVPQTNYYSYPMCAGKFYQFVLKYTPNPVIYNYINCQYEHPWETNLAINSFGCGINMGMLGAPFQPVYAEIARVEQTCDLTKPVAGSDSMMNPVFKVVPGNRMVFSAWVREECGDPSTGVPCIQEAYTDNEVEISFIGSISDPVILKPAGAIIDGWQRYEGYFTAPVDATALTVKLTNNSTKTAYFDDIRIHPFNANMKSYVYDPVTLKLTAELDANNYASFYEYDEEGTLIRTKVETKQGIKTINETRSARQRNLKTLQ